MFSGHPAGPQHSGPSYNLDDFDDDYGGPPARSAPSRREKGDGEGTAKTGGNAHRGDYGRHELSLDDFDDDYGGGGSRHGGGGGGGRSARGGVAKPQQSHTPLGSGYRSSAVHGSLPQGAQPQEHPRASFGGDHSTGCARARAR
eukprot:162506-Pelagomonas_calceolata.AAC.1